MASTTTKNGKGSSVTQQDLADQIAQIKGDIADLSDLLAQGGAESAQKLKGKAQEGVQAAQDRAEDLGEQAQRFVSEKPGTALGIAAGIGFLVGFLGARK